MNQDMNGYRKLFWKEVSKANGGKVENSKRIKDGNRRVALEEVEVRRIWKYYKDLYNVVLFWGSDGVWRGNFFKESQLRERRLR